MSKFAVRTFSNVLRAENKRFGVKVVVIEPVFYKTEIVNFERIREVKEKLFQDSPEEVKEFYLSQKDTMDYLKLSEKTVRIVTRPNVNEVVDAMVKAVSLREPKLFYRCCSYLDVILMFSWSVLPEILFDYIFEISFKSTALVNYVVKKLSSILKIG